MFYYLSLHYVCISVLGVIVAVIIVFSNKRYQSFGCGDREKIDKYV